MKNVKERPPRHLEEISTKVLEIQSQSKYAFINECLFFIFLLIFMFKEKLTDMSIREIVLWIVGLSTEMNQNENINLDVVKENEETQIIDISETSRQKLLCNILAILLMSCTGFLWAFFNRFD